jgi:hypothetical protein
MSKLKQQFIVTPVTLSPFFPQGRTLSQWQDAVLDILAYVPNVVVLAESNGESLREASALSGR